MFDNNKQQPCPDGQSERACSYLDLRPDRLWNVSKKIIHNVCPFDALPGCKLSARSSTLFSLSVRCLLQAEFLGNTPTHIATLNPIGQLPSALNCTVALEFRQGPTIRSCPDVLQFPLCKLVLPLHNVCPFIMLLFIDRPSSVLA